MEFFSNIQATCDDQTLPGPILIIKYAVQSGQKRISVLVNPPHSKRPKEMSINLTIDTSTNEYPRSD